MIENTSQRDPMLHLLGAMGTGTSTYITDMEAAGQRQLVASQEMPIDGPWDRLTQLGFVVGEKTDDLFQKVTLPAGWSREGSDHAMHSYVCDERGVQRVGVFYKAAFYDRRADCHLINVGGAASRQALYGDGPAALPDKWALFTEDERADFMVGLSSMAAQIEETPQVYGKYTERLAAIRDLLAVSA